MRGILGLAAAMALPGALAQAAWAQAAAPAALVEDVSAGVKGVEAFDYVSAGKQIQLGSGGKLVLGYLASCQEETIAGGIVTVGTDQSSVSGGSVDRKTVACAGKSMQLTAEQSGKSGGLVFRKPPSTSGATAPTPTAGRPRAMPPAGPVISLPKPGRLTIVRVDTSAAPVALDLPAKPVDLGKRGVRLAPGGTYQANYGASSVTFQIDAQSTADASPLARLIRF
ncbi:MAG TPA: hypothetical protein VJN67_03055 [Stellaceae bacterium]|nr:hypothetical protein [Stellaceae bacterium]